MYKCFNLENPLLGIYPNQIVRSIEMFIKMLILSKNKTHGNALNAQKEGTK